MSFKKTLIVLKTFTKINYFFKSINKNITKPTVNSFASSTLRLIFGFKYIFQKYYFLKKSKDLKSIDEFWIIRIGFVKERTYLPFITLDNYISNHQFSCNLKKLPFGSESCQKIYIKHFFSYFLNRNITKVINSFKKKLIPGGNLKIQIKLNKNNENFERLEKILIQNNFFIKNVNNADLKINGTTTITAIKQSEKNIVPINISMKKIQDISLILNQIKEHYSSKSKICIIGYHLGEIYNYFKKLGLSFDELQIFDSINSFSNISENYFDFAIIANYFEYFNYSFNEEIFGSLRRILKPNAKFLILIPNKKKYFLRESAQLFDKGIFLRIIDENNFVVKWINLSSSFKMIQILLQNQHNFPLEKSRTKVLLLGHYALRYTFLNNARWDGQARAFEKIGYDTCIFDFKDHSFPYLLEHIKLYNPDILWIGGTTGYHFLKKYADFLKASKIKVVYWMWDIAPIKDFDFKNIIDYMFITSKGEVQEYKKRYNLDKVYFMPTPIVPEIIHRNKYIKEIYDVGFAGLLFNTKIYPYYEERRKLLQFISQHFKVKIFKNHYNDLPEYYSKCKIIFGGTPALKDLELYASNRLYIALSDGCCFITNYFKGLEKLAENETHLLWFNNQKELFALLEKYLFNKALREEIKNNAEKLARLKHDYIFRLTNMLDIINNESEEFYGFIK